MWMGRNQRFRIRNGKEKVTILHHVRRLIQIGFANICEENQYQTCMEPAEKREKQNAKKQG